MSIKTNSNPPLSRKELEMIEYPGVVQNIDNMLATLGGLTNISQALGGEHKKRLELRYHPKNPFCKAACADKCPRAGLLLLIKVYRSKKHPEKMPHFKVHIIGHTKSSFMFDSLCDFQFLPHFLNKDNSNENVFAMKSLVPQSVTDIEYFNNTKMPLLSLPQFFSRVDGVYTGIFRNDVQDEGQHDLLGVLHKSTYDNRDVVAFSMVDSFPTRPDPQIVKRMKIKYVSDEQLERVRKLFEECPIWTRIALLYESGVSNDKLKCIIPSLAYYFSTGPWRTLYVRYDYDPRKDFNSRHYQTFDFRLRFRSGVAEFVANRKDTIKNKRDNPYELNTLVQDINYPYFEENKLPRSRQCILRYCDLRIPKIQEMLEKIPSPLTGATCNERTGWLPAGFDGQVRQIVSSAIMDLLRNYYRKEQIHAELDSVENIEQDDSDDSDADNFLTDNMDDMLEDIQIDS